MAQTIGGRVQLTIGGVRRRVKSAVTFNLGKDKNEMILGHDGPHGAKAMPQIPFLECEISLDATTRLEDLTGVFGEDVVLTASGRSYIWRDAIFAGDGSADSEEGAVQCRFESEIAEEL